MPEINMLRRFGRPLWKVRKIDFKIRRDFAQKIHSVCDLRVSIRFNRSNIRSAHDLTEVVARNHFDSKNETLKLFKKALNYMGSMAYLNLESSFQFTLNLGKLAPKYLNENNFNRFTRVFINTNDNKLKANILYTIKALEIIMYDKKTFKEIKRFPLEDQQHHLFLPPLPIGLNYPQTGDMAEHI